MITLSQAVLEEIQSRVDGDLFASADDVVTKALELLEDQLTLEKMLINSINSGECIEATPEFWAAKRKRFMEDCERDHRSG